MNESTVDQQEITKFASFANQWWDKSGAFKTLHDINPARMAFIKQYCQLAGLNALDVGCGGGILTEALAEAGALAIGIDAEAEAVAVAVQHAQENHLAIEYACMPIEDYAGTNFSVITCMEMLEHVNDPQLVINHCSRLLTPAGHLFLSTINRNIKAYAQAVLAAEYILKLLPKQTHDYKKFIKPSELAAMARKAGLDIIGLQGLNYNPFNRTASLHESVSVNYLMCCIKR